MEIDIRAVRRLRESAGAQAAVKPMVEALCRFARRYADQTEHDHAALLAAVRRGVLPAEAGI